MDQVKPNKFQDETLPTYFELETVEQIQAITAPVRYRMIVLLTEKAMTSAQLARALHITRQRAYYHLKVLETNGLVHLVGEQLVGEMLEKYYRAYGFIHTYRSLVAAYYQNQPQSEINRLLKAINDFVLTLIDETRENVRQEEFQEYFQWSYQFDSPLLLAKDQAQELREEIIDLCRRYLEIDHQNRSKEEKEGYIRVRNSIFLSPVPREFLDALWSKDPNPDNRDQPG